VSSLVPAEPAIIEGTIASIEQIDDATVVGISDASGDLQWADASFGIARATLLNPQGEVIPASDLGEGTRVQMWLGACGESLPPSCGVEVLQVASG
jgi:hypothetical protein